MKKPARRLAHQKTGSGLIPESLRSGLGRPAGCASELLPDACGLSFTFAQIEQLGTANPAATLYLDGFDQRAVRLENALYARSVRRSEERRVGNGCRPGSGTRPSSCSQRAAPAR